MINLREPREVTLPGVQSDTFGRLRVAEPGTLFDIKQTVDNQPLFFDDAEISGTGTSSTYNTNQASTTISVAAATAGARARQTFQRFNYQSGKSQLVYMTFTMGAMAAGITRRVGQFDASNGIFLEQNPTDARFVVRTFTSGAASDANFVAQANWNIDKLDGSKDPVTNPSGLSLDLSTSQILVISYEWLGAGSVFVGFVINGEVIYCNRFDNANINPIVYMSTPNLPLRYEIENSGVGGAADLVTICGTVISEGGRQMSGLQRSLDRDATPILVNNNTNFFPLLAIRLRSAYVGARITPLRIGVNISSAQDFLWRLLLNPTVAGTPLSFSALTDSAIEADAATANTTTVSGGTEIEAGYSFGSNGQSQALSSLESELQIGADIAGTADILVLAAQKLAGGNQDFYASLTWLEAV